MPNNFQNIAKISKNPILLLVLWSVCNWKETRILDGVACKDPSLLGF